ncbi:MAG: hypothetical protein SGILL_009331 [Bacillariaceae sp.]
MATVSVHVKEELNRVRLKDVSREQHVTNNTDNLLQAALEDVLPGVKFVQSDEYTMANPDLVALRKASQGRRIAARDYDSPASRAKARTAVMKNMQQAPMFTFETKPFWKFRFLLDAEDSTKLLIDLWSVPKNYKAEDMENKAPLPKSWSHEKSKVFHLVRQLYGQMLSSKLRYGIILIYEVWWFCRRDEDGDLKISRPFRKEETGPSVLQALVTMVGFDNLSVETTALHPKSAIKAPRDSKPKAPRNSKPKASGGKRKRAGGSGTKAQGQGGGGRKRHPATQRDGDYSDAMACRVDMWDCDLVGMTDNVKLLISDKFPSILIKLQRDASQKHVAFEIQQEATIYMKISKNKDIKKAIPRFHGYSDHLGVALLCTEREGPDFEEIGVENLSLELKMSAVESLRLLGQAGLLHNDVALRNVVQSRVDPKQAKIIDFGRAVFTRDQKLLQEQIEDLQQLLWIGA